MKERRLFTGGMDADTDTRNIAPNKFRFALNCLCGSSNGSSVGAIENRKGNVKIQFALPEGRSKVVGTCRDIGRDSLVYMVWNSDKHHCILRYNIKSNTIDKILYDEISLNLQEDIIITSINIVGDLLYWTDGYFKKFTYELPEQKDSNFNPPRKINLVKAYNYTNGIAVPAFKKYISITEEILDRIKYPPLFRPQIKYWTDASKKYNFLVGNLFQFATSYVYDDGENSVFSPISEVLVPLGQELADGTPTQLLPTYNNAISIIFNTGSEIVSKVKLYVRLLNDGDWYLFDTVNKYDPDGNVVVPSNILTGLPTLPNSYLFYNNEVLISVDQIDAARTFDYVGQIVDSSTIISDNRMVDGNITENYDNTKIDVRIVPAESQLSLSNIAETIAGTRDMVGGDLQTVQWDVPTWGAQQYIGFQFNFVFTIWDSGGGGNSQTYSFSATHQADDNYPTDMFTRLKVQIEAAIPDSSVSWVFISGGVYNFQINLIGVFPAWYDATDIFLYIYEQALIYKTFKEGFEHYFGVQYFDRAGRSGAININSECKKYVPFITEDIAYSGAITSYRKATQFNWEVYNKPPEWATHYQWFYARQTPKFLQYYYNTSSIDGNGNISIDIHQPLVDLVTVRPASELQAYSFTKGDRIRFIAHGRYSQPNSWWWFEDFIDTEIISLDLTSGYIKINDVGFTSKKIQVPAGWDYNVFEIYSPRKISDESIYFAVGDKMPIINPHTDSRYHAGINGNDQTYNTQTLDVPINQINTYQTWNPNIPGLYTFSFKITNPNNPLVNIYNLLQGVSIEVMGLTNPQSTFLNGVHILSQDVLGGTILSFDVTTTQSYPLLTDPIYPNFPPATGGFIRFTKQPSPAKGLFDFGDVYLKSRFAVKPPLIPIETERFSDYYKSNAISIGHPSVVIPDNKRQKYVNLRYSDKFLENTSFNGLSRFDFLNQKNIANDYGNITSLKQIGSTLKVLQENKNTSLDIGIEQLTGGGGDSINVVTSTKVFGNPRPSSLGYGCQNPESVGVNDRYLYFYDHNYGAFLRDSANGMAIISDLGMKSFFKRINKECRDAVRFKVFTGFNKKYDEVILSFVILYNYDNEGRKEPRYKIETVVFNEELNAWTTYLSYDFENPDGTVIPIDLIGNVGETLLTFMNGEAFLEDSNELRGMMFEQQKPMVIDVVGNVDQEKVKIFKAIGLSTNNNVYVSGSQSAWFGEHISIPPSESDELGHESILPANRFRNKEGVLYSEFLRDINTPMAGSATYRLNNGSVLRGEAITIRIVNESNKNVILYSVILDSIPSELSK